MDSNRKLINFKELLVGEFNNELTPIVIPCGNIRKVESILNSNQNLYATHNPTTHWNQIFSQE